MQENPYVLGAIAKLNRPYKPAYISKRERHIKMLGDRYRQWQGFTHGIVVEILSVNHVSLHLYDVNTGLIYLFGEKEKIIPVYVDFAISEISLVRKPEDLARTEVEL